MINHDHPVRIQHYQLYPIKDITPQRFGFGLGGGVGEMDLPKVHHYGRVFDGEYLAS